MLTQPENIDLIRQSSDAALNELIAIKNKANTGQVYSEQGIIALPITNGNTSLIYANTNLKTINMVFVGATTLGAITFEASFDGIIWNTVTPKRIDNGQVPTTISQNVIYTLPVYTPFIRIVRSGGSSNGTVQYWATDYINEVNLQSVHIASHSTQLQVIGVPANNSLYGTSRHRRRTTADTNLVNVKSSLCNIYAMRFSNNVATDVWVKLYNKASAPVIASDTSLIVDIIRVKANETLSIMLGMPFHCSSGLSYAITRGVAETDTTPTAVNDLDVFIQFL